MISMQTAPQRRTPTFEQVAIEFWSVVVNIVGGHVRGHVSGHVSGSTLLSPLFYLVKHTSSRCGVWALWSDSVLLRVVSYTAQCVRVVCSVSSFLCVPFLRLERCTRSPRTGLCQHAFLRERPQCNARRTSRIHTPQPLGAQTRIPSQLLSPGLQGN